MKKKVFTALSLVLCIGILSGCSKAADLIGKAKKDEPAENTADEEDAGENALNDDAEDDIKKTYGKLLEGMMTDTSVIYTERDNIFNVPVDGGYFMLYDINGDGVEELLITNIGDEFTLLRPAETFEDAHVCNFSKYNDEGMLQMSFGNNENGGVNYGIYDGLKVDISDRYTFENYGEAYYRISGNGRKEKISEDQYFDSAKQYGLKEIPDNWIKIDAYSIKKFLGYEIDENRIADWDSLTAYAPPAYAEAEFDEDEDDYEMIDAEEYGKVVEDNSFHVIVDTVDGGVNVRTGPGTEFAIIFEMVPDGTEFLVTEVTQSTKGKDWGKVTYEGQTGWIALSQVKRN